jgi:hypothetical protein
MVDFFSYSILGCLQFFFLCLDFFGMLDVFPFMSARIIKLSLEFQNRDRHTLSFSEELGVLG